MAKYIGPDQKDWDVYLPLITWAYNTSRQASLGCSPFELVYGREPVHISHFPSAPKFAVAQQHATAAQLRAEWATQCDRARKAAAAAITAAQAKQQLHYNTNRQPHDFKLLDRVWLKLPRVQVGLKMKLARLWTGPYRIAGLTDLHAKLQHIDSGKMLKLRVHVARLKPCITRLLVPADDESHGDVPGDADPFDPDHDDIDVIAHAGE